jgi:Transglutaminase-like superfamily
MHDIPPAPDEEYMPPIQSFTYRVLFYYSAYRTTEEFWKNEGKVWANSRNKFIGPGPGVSAAVRDLISPSDTQDQKLRKIYAAVMKLENTNYTREHSNSEEKAEGFKEIHNTDDIWARKRGNNDQLTALFVAMARAAGMKAYLMTLTSRDNSLFFKNYLSLNQLDDDIAIVNVDGKEQFFDPGSRYCPYQHLAWKHTMTQGLRQTDGGSDLAETPREVYTYSRTFRIANLKLDEQGSVTGNIKMTYMGVPALAWRQRSLTGDSTSLERELRTSMEHLVPDGMQVKVGSIEKLAEYEEPLVVNFEVTGGFGSSTGKRLLLPADIFEANSKATFPKEKRIVPVAFSYPHAVQDAIRITFPSTLRVESLPANGKVPLRNLAGYEMTTSSMPTYFTIRRNFVINEVIYMPSEYTDLRNFYSGFESKDQESVVLTTAPASADKPTPAAN